MNRLEYKDIFFSIGIFFKFLLIISFLDSFGVLVENKCVGLLFLGKFLFILFIYICVLF